MALGATIHTFAVQLADVDRGVYEDLTVRVARHPSETETFMMTRVLAYCLEFEEGIAFSEGISKADEPAVLVRDLTGRLIAWIEVGAPDADRLRLPVEEVVTFLDTLLIGAAVRFSQNPGPVVTHDPDRLVELVLRGALDPTTDPTDRSR